MISVALGLNSPHSGSSEVIEVTAEDGYLTDRGGVHLGPEHVGRRLRILNVDEVRGLVLDLAAVSAISIQGRQQPVLRLETRVSESAAKAINICKTRIDGNDWLIPVRGRWTADGTLRSKAGGATLACASGALGKCLEWGFAPWGVDADSFAACTRMVRADYCGDGRSHTQPGVLIAFERWRTGELPPAAPPDFHFEALWSSDGAHCLQATRVKALFAMDDLLQQCPDRALTEGALHKCHERVSSFQATLFANYVEKPPDMPEAKGHPSARRKASTVRRKPSAKLTEGA